MVPNIYICAQCLQKMLLIWRVFTTYKDFLATYKCSLAGWCYAAFNSLPPPPPPGPCPVGIGWVQIFGPNPPPPGHDFCINPRPRGHFHGQNQMIKKKYVDFPDFSSFL